MNKKEILFKIKQLYPYYTSLNLYKKKVLENILEHICIKYALRYNNNSCYMDSLLVALFNSKSSKVYDYFLQSPIKNHNSVLNNNANKIREELIYLYNNIISEKKEKNIYCTNLRKLLRDYENNYIKYVNKNHERNDWISSQSEPFQLLNFLDMIFNYKNNTKIEYVSYGSNKPNKKTLVRKRVDTESNINIINIDDLIGKDELYISKLYPKKISTSKFSSDNLWNVDSKQYNTKIEKITLLSSDFLIIHVNRLSYDNKLKTKIIPSLKIKMKENKHSIYLKSIIIHNGDYNGGHYTCLYECKNVWYEYDDTKSKMKIIGEFDNIINYKNGYYMKNCTDLIYI